MFKRKTLFFGLKLALLCGALAGIDPAWAQDAPRMSWSAMLLSAGWAIVFTLALSVWALAVALERFVRCTPKRLAPNGMRAAVLGAAQRADWPKAQQLSADKPSALADGLTRLLALRHLGREGAIAAAGDAASRSLRAHVQKAYPLAVIATVAPIVGLLGTVVGMIDAFHVIAFAGMGDPTLLAGGISKALVNTAAGLCVALPALVLHHFFKQRIAAVGLTIEAELHQVADAMFAPGEQRAH